ncbi:MAG: phosphoglucosamine mutase [Alphaproteobacteria bacterium]|nr:phosphoglucosamine mutase [Alphaproteobacteria bacterium]
MNQLRNINANQNKRYFGTDGMRGRVNIAPMTPEIVMRLAMAVGYYFKKQNKVKTKRVIIGKDTRLSGYMLEPALTSAFISLGYDVLLLGPVPTPGVSMLTRSLRADIGVMLSASHNPFADNGIKIFDSHGCKLNDATELEIESYMEQEIPLIESDMVGRAKRLEDVPGRYIEYLKAQLPRGIRLNNIKIVVDAAHGAAYKIAPAIFWELGAEVIATGVNPNGTNINEKCGATHPNHVAQIVKDNKADLGIALDGDADRIQLVDSKGNLYSGDDILAIIATYWRTHQKLLGHAVVSTIMANMGFEHYLKTLGIGLWRTQVGDRYVAEKMIAEGCNLGGEPSGHVIMNDYTNTGDGVMSALQILSCLLDGNRDLSDFANLYQKTPNYSRNFRFEVMKDGSSRNLLAIEEVQKIIIQQDKRLQQNNARLIIRESGTEPVIRIMAEGSDKNLLNDSVDNIYGTIEKHHIV